MTPPLHLKILEKKAYETLKAYPEKAVFADYYTNPFQNFDEEDDKFKKIQRFVVLMYSRTSAINDVNEARIDLYFS